MMEQYKATCNNEVYHFWVNSDWNHFESKHLTPFDWVASHLDCSKQWLIAATGKEITKKGGAE